MTTMSLSDVNADFNDTAVQAAYSYRPSPVQERSYLIYRAGGEPDGRTPPVGDYTVLDLKEDSTLSEKKVMNLVSLLNGRKKLMQLGHETKSRVLYRVLPEKDKDNRMSVIFYHLGHEGNSVENALFRMREDDHETC